MFAKRGYRAKEDMMRKFAIALLSAVMFLTPPVALGATVAAGAFSVDAMGVNQKEERKEAQMASPTITLKYGKDVVGEYTNWNQECRLPLGKGIDMIIHLPVACYGLVPSDAALVRGQNLQTKKPNRYGQYNAEKGFLTLTSAEYLPLLADDDTLDGQLTVWIPGALRRETEYRFLLFFTVKTVSHGTAAFSRTWSIQADRSRDVSLAPVVAGSELRTVTAAQIRKRCFFLGLVRQSGVRPAGPGTDSLMLGTGQAGKDMENSFKVDCQWDGDQRVGPVLRVLVFWFTEEQMASGSKTRPLFRVLPGSGLRWQGFVENTGPSLPDPQLTADVDGLIPVMLVDTSYRRGFAMFVIPTDILAALPPTARFALLATSEGGGLLWKVEAPNSSRVSFPFQENQAGSVALPGSINLNIIPAECNSLHDGSNLGVVPEEAVVGPATTSAQTGSSEPRTPPAADDQPLIGKKD